MNHLVNRLFAKKKLPAKVLQTWQLTARWVGRQLLRASEEPKSGAVKSDEAECFLSTRNRKHSHSLNSATRNAVSKCANDTYPCPAVSGKEQNLVTLPRKRLPQASSFLQSGISFGSRTLLMVAASIGVSHCSLIVKSETCGLAQQGHGLLGWRGNRHWRETLEDADREEGKKWKPPTREPLWPWALAYNSALTSSSGHPVALVTMIPEVCPPPPVTTEIWKLHHSNAGAIGFFFSSPSPAFSGNA